MISKKNSILLALLLVQAVLIIFLYRPASTPAFKEADLSGGMTPENIVELTITDNTGEQLVVTTNGEKQWRITSVADTPLEADSEKINAVLRRLSTLTSNRLVTRTSASHLRLRVAENEFEKKISMKSQNGQSTTFFLGSSSRAQGLHLRVAAQDEVYLVQGISSWEFETDIDSWRQKELEAKEEEAEEDSEPVTSQ